MDKELGQLRALSVLRPDSRQAIPCASPRRKPELGQELGQGTWTNFITCFPLTEPLVQVCPGNLDKELRAAVLQALLVLRPDSRQAPIPTSWPRAETRTWTRTWTRNLDKFYHVFSSCRATCPSSPGELGQGTWTTAGCRVTSSLSIAPRFQSALRPRFCAEQCVLDTRCTASPCSRSLTTMVRATYKVIHPVPPPLFGALHLHARRPAAQQRPHLFHAVDRRAVRVAQRLQRPQPLREALRKSAPAPSSSLLLLRTL